jgi:hypothetical protein
MLAPLSEPAGKHAWQQRWRWVMLCKTQQSVDVARAPPSQVAIEMEDPPPFLQNIFRVVDETIFPACACIMHSKGMELHQHRRGGWGCPQGYPSLCGVLCGPISVIHRVGTLSWMAARFALPWVVLRKTQPPAGSAWFRLFRLTRAARGTWRPAELAGGIFSGKFFAAARNLGYGQVFN